MEKEQYRITQRLNEKWRYADINKLADDNRRSMNSEINQAIDLYIAWNIANKKFKSSKSNKAGGKK